MTTPFQSPAPVAPSVVWNDPARQSAFEGWLQHQAQHHGLDPQSLRAASADASFRRYFRVQGPQGSLIIMDAPPEKENSEPFVRIAGLMRDAGMLVPRVLAWDAPQGFMLLDDLGQHTMMEVIDPTAATPPLALYQRALDALLLWQGASQPGVLPAYDTAMLRRELELFPDWYLCRHRGITLTESMRGTLDKCFELIIANNLRGRSVYVHRDFMPRNLMMPANPDEPRLGVLDFQDAVQGPITYDVASLMRDAFLTWDEDFVIDVTVRYWERARTRGLLDAEGWSQDFGEFWRAVEWMGLQRHLKVAGIFARLTLRDGKPKYLADTPRFIRYIRSTASRYRELTPLLRLIDQVEGIQGTDTLVMGRG
jgi:aminoglycoside/choline kinase family phosphotransferase